MEHHWEMLTKLDLRGLMEDALRQALGEDEYAKRRRRKRS
jgi:hypothetical protein